MLTVLEETYEKVLCLDSKLINFWEDVINSGLITEDKIEENPVTAQLKYKWRRNLRGLLITEFKIPEIYVYPNVRINNVTNYSFNKDNIYLSDTIKVIDANFIESMYEDYLIKWKK